jgi:hypothetical protein
MSIADTKEIPTAVQGRTGPASNPTGRANAIELAAVLAVMAIVAAWIDLGPIHKFHNSDTLVPVLASLYRWTPFYWGQNRLGALLPLLACPFKHPMVNMLVQYGLATWLALSAFFLGARYVMGKGPWLAAGAIGAAIYIIPGIEWTRFVLLMGHHEYGTSLAIGLAGLLILDRPIDRRRWPIAALGCLCFLLASWVNMAVVATLLPIVLTRDIIRGANNVTPQSRAQGSAPRPGLAQRVGSALVCATARRVGALSASIAAAYALSKVAPYRAAYKLDPLGEWGHTCLRMWQEAWGYIDPACWLAAGALVLLCAAVALCAKSRKQALLAGLAAAAPFVAGALGNCLMMGATNWPRQNDYAARYLTPSFTMLFLATGAFSSAAVLRLPRPVVQRVANWLLVVALAAVMIVMYPAPSLAKVRSALDGRTGSLTQEVLAAKCTHIMGSYWNVWAGVFHANLVNYERGRRGRRSIIWGIANRAGPTLDQWSNVPIDQVRVAEPIGDEKDSQWAQDAYRVWPLVKDSQLTKINVYRRVPPVPQASHTGL